MRTDCSRRVFVAGAPVAALAAAILPLPRARADAPARDGGLHDVFPRQNPDLARQAVAFSHGNIDGLRELLDDQPELAKASWDWGFGDWESCLGAASHTGRVEIAELLLERGARPSLFSAAMLGQLAVVRAFVEASPGVQRIPGPHGITLLAHARAGGERARAVREYLESLGDADEQTPDAPLDPADRDRLVGDYAWSPAETDRLIVEVRREALAIHRPGSPPRSLSHRGEFVFSAAGAPSVRIAITEHIDADPARVFEVFSDVTRAAERIGSVKEVKVLTDGPVGEGTRFRETRRMFGKEATEELEFTDFRPPRSYTIECESCGAHFASVFTFEPERGGTRVSMDMRSKPLTIAARLLSPMGLFFAGAAKKAMRQDILELKRVAEGEVAAAPA